MRSTEAIDPTTCRDHERATEGTRPLYPSLCLCAECAEPGTGTPYGWGSCSNCGRRDQLAADATRSPDARGPFTA